MTIANRVTALERDRDGMLVVLTAQTVAMENIAQSLLDMMEGMKEMRHEQRRTAEILDRIEQRLNGT